jgi:alpha-L-fucosidase
MDTNKRRPWSVYGEGPSVSNPAPKGQFGGTRDVRTYTGEDIRFTTVGQTLNAFVLAWPEGGKVTIKTLAQGSAAHPKEIARKTGDAHRFLREKRGRSPIDICSGKN